MERIRALINKLQQQAEEQASVSTMMMTVQALQAELAQLSSPAPQMSTAKVAVVMPSSNKASYTQISKAADIIIKEAPKEPVAEQPAAAPVRQKEPLPLPVEEKEEVMLRVPEKAQPKKQDQSGWLFDTVQEIPTLAHQTEFKEMNELYGGNNASLNDKLKTERKELASVLTEGPVRDLKKAIGINDRFVFLSELFRGDETMYERSIKTINNFRIYPEAEYWIERELKVKLGWDESKAVVKQFCNLVRRRFA